MIYIKKIINNDIARTPTFNKESILEFFKINLTNGESTVLDIRLLPNNIDYSIKFQKRNTRDEYRIFLNDLFTTINPKEEDILIFRRTRKLYTCEHISQISESYKHLDNLFESESNHEVIIEESSDNPIENINYNFLNEFSDWLIQNEGSKHNYFKDSFSLKRENLIEGLLKYEDVYENQFGEKTFSFPKSELNVTILPVSGLYILE